MPRLIKSSKKSLILMISSIVLITSLTSCTTVRIADNRVNAYWLEKGEKAPFKGVLLNEYTFEKLKSIAAECTISGLKNPEKK